MSSRFRISLAVGLALLAASASARTLTVCAEPDNLPFSRADGTGFEVEIAQLLAGDIAADVRFAWLSSRNVHGFVRKTLGKGLCDAIVGMPEGTEGVLETRPYYRTGWVFVTRTGGPVRSFEEAAQHESVGVPVAGDGYDTAPAAALARRGAIGKLRVFPINGPNARQQVHMLDAVDGNRVDVAVAWGPQAGWYAASHADVSLTPTPASDGTLPLTEAIAVAVAPGNTSLRDALDAALARNEAAVTAILRKWHVPLLPMEAAK
jgi:mxaJ protein